MQGFSRLAAIAVAHCDFAPPCRLACLLLAHAEIAFPKNGLCSSVESQPSFLRHARVTVPSKTTLRGGMKNTSVSILQRLVSFDTTSRNSNLALIEWAADYLESRGARVELVHNATGDKANLLGTVGPDREGGVVLSGHTDVVPVDGQEWTSDPFSLVERKGLLYGRGSSDMKGFIACSLAAAENWKDMKLLRPLHFALSYDEEVGCFGAHSLVQRMRAEATHLFVIREGEV
jgi:acetylornithine deacetylase/succinyl-diaminopimelate desuccinylase-like protein